MSVVDQNAIGALPRISEAEVGDYLALLKPRVMSLVIFTALATLGAFLYNLASAMIGGLEVTLAED